MTDGVTDMFHVVCCVLVVGTEVPSELITAMAAAV